MANPTISVRVTGDSSGFRAALGDAQTAASGFQGTMEGIGTQMQTVGDRLSSTGRSMTMGVTLPLVGIGAASFSAAADLQDAMGATEQVFGDSADDVKRWAESLDSYYGIAESDALAYSNMMGSMLQNIGGLSEDEAASQAAVMLELAGDLTAMYGGTTQDAVNALTGALKGNNTMLDNYGMSATDAQIKAKALEMGLWDGEGAMDAQAKQAATLALIMEQSGAAQGQAARESEGASGQMRAFTTDAKNLGAEIGANLLPIGAALIEKLRGMFDWFSNLSPETQKTITVIAGLVAAIGPLLIVTGKVISAIGAISKAMAFLAANPVVLIIAAIAALVAGLIYAYQNFEGFRNIVDTVFGFVAEKATWLWEEILQPTFEALASFTTETLVPTLQSLWEKAQEVFEAIGTAISFAWSNVISPIFSAVVWYIENVYVRAFRLIWDVVSTVFSNVVGVISGAWGAMSGTFSAIRGGIDSVRDTIRTRVDQVVGFFTGLPGRISSAAGDLFGWIGTNFRAAINAVVGMWNGVRFPSFTMGGWDPPGPGPRLPSVTIGGWSLPRIPYLAEGGIVTGPTLAMIGEGNSDEAVFPLPRDWRRNGPGGGDTYNITVNAARMTANEIEAMLTRLLRQKGRLEFAS